MLFERCPTPPENHNLVVACPIVAALAIHAVLSILAIFDGIRYPLIAPHFWSALTNACVTAIC